MKWQSEMDELSRYIQQLTDELEYKANNFTNWYDFMFHFDEKNATHMNFLFELKLKMFDEKKVKEMSEDKKNLIRDSLNPLRDSFFCFYASQT